MYSESFLLFNSIVVRTYGLYEAFPMTCPSYFFELIVNKLFDRIGTESIGIWGLYCELNLHLDVLQPHRGLDPLICLFWTSQGGSQREGFCRESVVIKMVISGQDFTTQLMRFFSTSGNLSCFRSFIMLRNLAFCSKFHCPGGHSLRGNAMNAINNVSQASLSSILEPTLFETSPKIGGTDIEVWKAHEGNMGWSSERCVRLPVRCFPYGSKELSKRRWNTLSQEVRLSIGFGII